MPTTKKAAPEKTAPKTAAPRKTAPGRMIIVFAGYDHALIVTAKEQQYDRSDTYAMKALKWIQKGGTVTTLNMDREVDDLEEFGTALVAILAGGPDPERLIAEGEGDTYTAAEDWERHVNGHEDDDNDGDDDPVPTPDGRPGHLVLGTTHDGTLQVVTAHTMQRHPSPAAAARARTWLEKGGHVTTVDMSALPTFGPDGTAELFHACLNLQWVLRGDHSVTTPIDLTAGTTFTTLDDWERDHG